MGDVTTTSAGARVRMRVLFTLHPPTIRTLLCYAIQHTINTSSSRRLFLETAPSEHEILAPHKERYPLGTSDGSDGTERYHANRPSS